MNQEQLGMNQGKLGMSQGKLRMSQGKLRMNQEELKMDQKQLEKSNIDNLSNLWKLMGANQSPLNSNHVVNTSVDWPNRMWLDWEVVLQSEDQGLLFSQIEKQSKIVFPVWNETHIELIDILEKNGFKELFKQTAMILPLENQTQLAPNSLDFQEVTTSENARIWTEIASQSFGYYIHPPIIQGILGSSKLKLVLAFLDQVPVGTGLVFEDSGVVGIHLVGVPPSHRRQGIARKLMHHLLEIAHESDLSYAALQASVKGEPLYQELGFQKQFTFTSFSNSD